MTDIERAIETLKDMKSYFNDRSHRQYSMPAINLAIEALEKQIPKKPNIYTDVRNELYPDGADKGTEDIDTYVCPACDMYIVECECLEEYMPAYCDDCGQKLDWGNEDEKEV